jgi:biotin carboxyl carrier protein
MEGRWAETRVKRLMKYTAIIDGQTLELEIDNGGSRIEASVGGRHYVLESRNVEPGVYWFNWNNRSIELSVTPSVDAYVVSVNGHQSSVEILDTRSALRKTAQLGHSGEVELRAPMPGKIVKILVQEGAAIEANHGVLVMEAMKMQNEIKSPKAGVVKRIAVAEAAAVNSGELLAIVE